MAADLTKPQSLHIIATMELSVRPHIACGGKEADMAGQPTTEQLWRSVLTGDHPDMRRGRWLHRLIPSSPRCKMCNAPFGAPGTFYMRLRGRGPSNLNPRFCNF
jgi:hypothetical protein